MFKMLGGRSGVGGWVMVEGWLLKQHSQHSNASTENTAWLNMESIVKEMMAKAYIYNMLINIQN